MLRCAVLGLVLSTLFFSGWAQAQTGSIRVQVNGHREVHGEGKPPGQVAVTDMETREDTIRELSPNGRADFGNLKDGNYIVTVNTGDRTGTTTRPTACTGSSPSPGPAWRRCAIPRR